MLHGLSALPLLKKLCKLCLTFSKSLTNEDMSVLKDCPWLMSLDLMYSSGIENIQFLSSFSKLEVLNLCSTKVSSLSPLVGCISLRDIDLRDTGVSDLSPLQNSTCLRKIKLKRVPLEEEAEWLRKLFSGGERLASLVRTR